MIRFFGYERCSTCRTAKQHLTKMGVVFTDIDIITKPPSKALLTAILKTGEYELGDLFNRSGDLYREMKMKDKLKTMSEADAVALLAKHGKLIKRPIVSDGTQFTVGYDADWFAKIWG